MKFVKQRPYILHFLGILAFLSIPILTSPDRNQGLDLLDVPGFRQNFLRYILLAGFFYLNYYLLIPKFYFTRKYIVYALAVVLCYVAIILPHVISEPMIRPPGMHRPPPMMGIPDGGMLLQFLFVLTLSFLIKVNNQLSELSNERLSAEVSYLKAQINPHFLFNTLNSLYALTLEKSDAAPDAVVKLSGMMRYVVTESSKDRVALEREIAYIRDYIELQKLRIVDHSRLTFTVSGDTTSKQIAPLLVIPFIENAFKYGVSDQENWTIEIHIDIADWFCMKVTNDKVASNFNDEDSTEQGVLNTKKRLEYMYPGQHSLVVDSSEHRHEVELKINLS